jgi:FkbM family methyltransferase
MEDPHASLARDLDVPALAKMTRAEAEKEIRARCRTVYLGDHLALARVLGHAKMFLSTSDVGFASHVMLDGFWEIWLTLFFAQVVAPGMTVIDVGANFGYYTLLFGNAVGPSGHVIAIEPVPPTAALLGRTVEVNGLAGRTRVVAAAAWERPDARVHMLVRPDEPKNAAVIGQPKPGSIVVPTTTVDELTRGLARLDLVKIDAEGAELAVIAGMRETIARLKPRILLEFNAARYQDPSTFLTSVAEQYRCFRALNFDGELEAVTRETVVTARYGEDWLLFFQP